MSMFVIVKKRVSANRLEIDASKFPSQATANESMAVGAWNQAIDALGFMHRHGLEQPMDKMVETACAENASRLPAVLTTDEVARALDKCAFLAALRDRVRVMPVDTTRTTGR